MTDGSSGESLAILSRQSLESLKNILIDRQLTRRPEVERLLDGLDPSYLVELPLAEGHATVRDRLHSELIKINSSEVQGDGLLPIMVFLENTRENVDDQRLRDDLDSLIEEAERHAGTPERSPRNGRLLKYLGREHCWHKVWTQLRPGFSVPKHFSSPDNTASEPAKSLAVLWEYESVDDKPDHLADALCWWLRSRGDKHSDVANRPNSAKFGWSPQYKSPEAVFESLADALEKAIPGDPSPPHPADEKKVLIQINRISASMKYHSDSFACISTDIPPQMAATAKTVALQFIDEWNRVEWPRLEKPLLFVIFIKREPPGFWARALGGIGIGRKREESEPSIGKIESSCFQNWFYSFARERASASWISKLESIEREIEAGKWKDSRYDQLSGRLGVY